MFNNPVLDVAIGLTFMYVLYSLLATTIKEFIATIFDYRGKMLVRGIEQMLDGKNIRYFWWHRIWNFLFNSKEPKPGTRLYAKKELFAHEIASHTLFVRSAENGLSDKPSYLAADTFSDILIDILNPNKTSPVLLKDIETEIQRRLSLNTCFNKELADVLTLYLQQANGDVQRFKLLVENWYNGMMDRVTGWYKRQANRILIIIGLCLAIAFNVSTIDIVVKLSKDKDVREALVKNATEYVKTHIDSAKAGTGADTAKKDTSFAALRARLDSMKALYNANIAENNTTLGLGWGDFGFTQDSIAWVKKGSVQKDRPKHKQHIISKVGYVLWQTAKTPRYWLGFLITAFAISLGAPFWFDLLNKFINLRVSGAKPAEASGSAAKTANLNKKPDPTAKG